MRFGHLRGAWLLSSDWNTLASALAYPEFVRHWQAGGWPEFLVWGIHL